MIALHNLYLKIIEKTYLWFTISLIFIVIGFGLMGIRFLNQQPILNFGIDFTGGTNILLKINSLSNEFTIAKEKKQSIEQINIITIKNIRKILDEKGFTKNSIQITGDKEVVIRTTSLTKADRDKIIEALTEKMGTLELLEADTIGPSFGSELREKSLWIILLVFACLMIYITWRFEFSFGVGALISLIHDALAVMSFASIFYLEIDTSFVAAILTILGYSINDTIVIFDRIRENFKNINKEGFVYLINSSICQTFSRTINTVITVLLVLFALILFGGTTIKGFIIVLFFGVIIGTYSSIFIAPSAMFLSSSFTEQINKKNQQPQSKYKKNKK